MNPERILKGMTDGARLDDPDGEILIRVEDAGELWLPTGQIVASDPGQLVPWSEVAGFERAVPPGRYPVQVSVARFAGGGERAALSVLRLRPTAPVRFELATRPGEDLADLEDGEFYGHGVDSAASAFLDLQAARELVERNKSHDYFFKAGGYVELWALGRDREWRNSVIDPTTGLNMVIVHSGYGDGRYASYWGFDAEDHVACLLTDFHLLLGTVCPDCCAEVGQPHTDFPCASERCPFCDGWASSCNCIKTVLSLSEEDRELINNYRYKGIYQDVRVRVDDILARWNAALTSKGRVPFRQEDLEDDD